jgi:hypothetical protein
MLFGGAIVLATLLVGGAEAAKKTTQAAPAQTKWDEGSCRAEIQKRKFTSHAAFEAALLRCKAGGAGAI